MADSGTIELTGADDVAASLRRIGAAASDVDTALDDHGAAVVATATRLAPVRTGRLRAALSHQVSSGTLTVDAGVRIAPHAYTMHAVAMGKSRGGMTFTVPAHTRRGSQVRAYRAARYIPNRPYLWQAWQQELPAARDRIITALAAVFGRG